MASAVISSNPATNTHSRKKKKKTHNQSGIRDDDHLHQASSMQWKSDTQQQVYSSKLLQALRHVSTEGLPKRGRAVREAADRVLAAAARGRTRWSRAILTNRVKLKFMKKGGGRAAGNGNRMVRPAKATTTMVMTTTTGLWRQRKPKLSVLRLKAKSLPAFQRKARLLGRLVPGCRKESLPVILEEATDYIAALEMQVRAMTALSELISGAASSSSSSSANQLGSSG